MSVYAIKILAVAAMFTDHLAHMLWSVGRMEPQLYFLFRTLGRMGFPIFAFLIANGLEHSSDRKKYLSRLIAFAVISQSAFSLLFGSKLMPLAYASGWQCTFSVEKPVLLALAAASALLLYRDARMLLPAAAVLLPFCDVSLGGLKLLGYNANVFYTLALGMAFLWLTDVAAGCRDIRKALKLTALSLCWLAATLLLAERMDYGWQGLALIAALGLCRGKRPVQAALLALWCALYYLPDSVEYCLGALLSVPVVLAYNGERGRRTKLGFYAFYPAHLLVLALVGMYLA